MIKRQLKLLAFVLAYEVVLVAAFAGLAVLMGGRAYPSYVTVPLWAGFLALFAAPMVAGPRGQSEMATAGGAAGWKRGAVDRPASRSRSPDGLEGAV